MGRLTNATLFMCLGIRTMFPENILAKGAFGALLATRSCGYELRPLPCKPSRSQYLSRSIGAARKSVWLCVPHVPQEGDFGAETPNVESNRELHSRRCLVNRRSIGRSINASNHAVGESVRSRQPVVSDIWFRNDDGPQVTLASNGLRC